MMENKAEKKVVPKKKKQLIAIIASVCVVVILAICIPIGIIYGNKNTTPNPVYSEFNDNTDYYIRVKWNKIRGAQKYIYAYCYGEPKDNEAKECQTQNTSAVFPRHKGKIAFRVKADIVGEKTQFSNWIYLDASPWKLEAPIPTLTDNLDCSWAKSTYKMDDKPFDIEEYEYQLVIDGEDVFTEGMHTTTNVAHIKDFVKNYLKNAEGKIASDKVLEYYLNGNWQDIKIEVKVRAVAYVTFAGSILTNPSREQDKVLISIYDDSDFASAEIVITEEIFNRIME